MAITYIIDPLAIATQGLSLPGAPLTVATLGWIEIFEEIIPPIEPPQFFGGGGGGRSGPGPGLRDGRKISDLDKFRKKITVKVMYKGKQYTDSVILDDLTVTANDVSVKIDESDLNEGVKIKIIMKKDLI